MVGEFMIVVGWALRHWAAVLTLCVVAVSAGAEENLATPEDPFQGVDWKNLRLFENALRMDAEVEARGLAMMYREANWLTYPGIHELGVQVLEALDSKKRPLDFEALVSRNFVFWRAEREMSSIDASFPYFVAVLAYLSGERATAARLIAIAQASLPLTPWYRRIYARPEAYMLQLERFYHHGIFKLGQGVVDAPYDETKAVLEARISRWPHSSGLWQSLVELEVTQATKKARKLADPEILNRVIYDEVGLTLAEARKARDYDFVMGSALEHTVSEWLADGVIAQRWNRWVKAGDPAVEEEVAETVALYEKHGRLDLAWLFWRHQMALNPLSEEKDREHWKVWSRELLSEEESQRLELLVEGNPASGTAAVPIQFEETSEAWSGDPGINPLVVVRAERQLAITEARLRFIKQGTKQAAVEHLMRANIFYDIGSVKGLRRELDAARSILKPSNKGVRVFEAHLASLLGDHETVKKIYRSLLDEVQHTQAKKEYSFFFYIAGSYAESRSMLLEMTSSELPGYRAILVDLLARRQGERAKELLHQEKRLIQSGIWVEAGILFLEGEIKEEELLTRAKSGSSYEVAQHECEAWFWISQVRLGEGDVKGGMQALRRCLSTGFTPFIEYKTAQAELKRLEAAYPEEKPEEKTKRNSRVPLVS